MSQRTGYQQPNPYMVPRASLVEPVERPWFSSWIYCLKNRDDEAAHIIRYANDEDYRKTFEAGRLAQIKLTNQLMGSFGL